LRWQCTYTYRSDVGLSPSYWGTKWIVYADYVSRACPAHSTGAATCTCTDPYVSDTTATSCVAANSCPSGMSGSPCACDTGFVPNSGGSCDPEVLTISLSGGTTTEPWHKKWDRDHTSPNSNLSYSAVVKNQLDQPKPGIGVSIWSEVTPGSGGHAHDNNRPKGWLAETPADITAQIQAGASQGSGSLGGVTDSAGTFAFTFGAEEASGEHTITVTCDGCTNNPQSTTIKVEIPGLMQLDADPLSYELRGSTDGHPGNHYFSEAAMVQIINLAFAYSHSPSFNNQLLKINDSSLIKGGTFDVNLDWTSLTNVHGGHRVGIVVDINNYHQPDSDFKNFVEYSSTGIQARWHGQGTGPHYHLLLLGEDH
jgi:hypothetical protein